MSIFTSAIPGYSPEIKGSGDKKFYQQQLRIKDIFKRGEDKIFKVINESKKMECFRDKLREFQRKNENLDVANLDVENITQRRRLRRRKWFTIVAEAILSLTAIRFFLGETVSISLPFLPTLLLGIILAYILLDMAIEYRMDADQLTDSQFRVLDLIKRYSFILSLILIPALNLFVIFSTPDNPMNTLYLFFAVISFLLNLKATSYYDQYRILHNTEKAIAMNQQLERDIRAQQKLLDGLAAQISDLRNQITTEAMNLRFLYEAYPKENRPTLILPPKYLFIMNNKIFYSGVFLIPDLIMSRPPEGELADTEKLWGIVFDFGSNTHVDGSAALPKVDNQKPADELPSGNDDETENGDDSPAQENQTKKDGSNQSVDHTTPEDDSSTRVSDNEKFV